MEDERKRSKLLIVIFWLSAIGCFIFGYYNTVLGLQTFDVFGSNTGGWFLALIPLVMVFGGYLASVQGTKGMLALYLVGETIFFIFNLTYLYPQYLGRTLVSEEAKALRDSVSSYQGYFDNILIKGDARLERMKETQMNLLDEISKRKGFGPRATEQLRIFNELAGTVYTPSRYWGETDKERIKLLEEWKQKTDDGIAKYFIHLNGDDKSAERLIASKADMDVISKIYIPKLDIVLQDNSDVSINHQDVAENPQIGLMKELTEKLNKVASDVNSVQKSAQLNQFDKDFPATQKLGRFEHTIISVKDRINKVDTWGVIIICLFFDLLGPFLFYFYLRKDDDSDFGSDSGAFDLPWWKRILQKY